MRALRKWWLKAGVQGVVSLLPERASEALNGKLQALGSGGAALRDTTVAHKVEQSRHHIAAWEQFHAKDGAPLRVLEVGTGWYPLVPLLMYASGADLVQSFDVRQLTTPARIRAACGCGRRARRFARGTSDGRPDRPAARARQRHRRRARRAPPRDACVVSHRPGQLLVCDARLVRPGDLGQHAGAHSRATDPRAVCGDGRCGGTGGVIDHYVDASDHYAHFDRSITEYNFLRWDDRAWKLINNRLLYQNRLRQGDYTAALERAGLCVVASEWTPGRPEEVASLPLAPRFRDRPVEELAPLRGYVTA